MIRFFCFIIVVFAVNTLWGQKINLDFENKRIPRSWEISENGVEIYEEEGCKSKTALIMAGPGAYIQTKKLDYPGHLEFNYKSDIPALEVGFSLIIEYFSKLQKDWVLLDRITPTYQQALYFMKSNKLPEEATYIRLRMAEYLGGTIIIDNIVITPMTNQRIATLEFEKKQKEMSEKIFQDIQEAEEQEEYDNVAKAISGLGQKYISNLNNLQKIYDKASSIYITQKTAELIFRRSEMANPLSYDEFKKWVETLKNLSDNALKSYLEDLEKQFEEQKNSYEKQKQFMRKVNRNVNIAINIGNIITGGKLSSIINSFKGIFATCYSKGNLESIYPVYEEEQVTISGRRNQNQIVTTLVKNMTNIRKIDTLLRQGRNEYSKLSAFFEIIENENTILTNQANLWKLTNSETNQFRKELYSFIKYYTYAALEDTSHVTNDMLDKFLNEDAKAKKQIEKRIKDYFNSFLGNENSFTGFNQNQEDEIDRMKYNIRKVEQKAEDYYKVANKFFGLYQNLEIDLNRSNPFTQYDKSNKQKYFTQAAESWEKIRNASLPIVIELKKEIKQRYVDIDIIATRR